MRISAWSDMGFGILAHKLVRRFLGLIGIGILARVYEYFGYPRFAKDKVTVVVPIYNVEDYLEACLRSIAVQNYFNLEVMMINDGSQDSSAEIAARYARRDPRFRLVTKLNGGLGAARNTGISLATGRYLAFVDSDDVVPVNAYEIMVKAISCSGSDFAVGAVERITEFNRWRESWVDSAHSQNLLGVKIEQVPEVTKNVFAWSKLYRTEFFTNSIGTFPEGVLNEDQEVAALAYSLARKFDVLADTIYFWRVRGDGTSITQNRLQLKNLNDRLSAEKRVAAIYREHADPMVQVYRWRDFVGEDLSQFYSEAAYANDQYWGRISEYLYEQFESLPSNVWEGVEVRQRCLAYLVSRADRNAARQLLKVFAEYPSGVPLKPAEGRCIVDVAVWNLGHVSWPDEVVAINDIDQPLITGVTRLEWIHPGELLIEGFCYVPNSQTPVVQSEINGQLVHLNGARESILVERFTYAMNDPELPRTSYAQYSDAGIRIRLTTDEVVSETSSAHLELQYSAPALSRVGKLSAQDAEHRPCLPPYRLSNRISLYVSADSSGTFTFGRSKVKNGLGKHRDTRLAEVSGAYQLDDAIRIVGNFVGRRWRGLKILFLSSDGLVREPASSKWSSTPGHFVADFLFTAEELRVNVDGSARIFGLCVVDGNARNPLATARPVSFGNQNRNGHRKYFKVSDGLIELSDFGHRRSVLVRRAQNLWSSP